MREFTAAQADDLYELLTERIGHPGRSLILTSNRSPADWYPLFPNAVVGESILDRVLNTSHHLTIKVQGCLYRPSGPDGEGQAKGQARNARGAPPTCQPSVDAESADKDGQHHMTTAAPHRGSFGRTSPALTAWPDGGISPGQST